MPFWCYCYSSSASSNRFGFICVFFFFRCSFFSIFLHFISIESSRLRIHMAYILAKWMMHLDLLLLCSFHCAMHGIYIYNALSVGNNWNWDPSFDLYERNYIWNDRCISFFIKLIYLFFFFHKCEKCFWNYPFSVITTKNIIHIPKLESFVNSALDFLK